MFYKRTGFPQEDEIVLCTVTNVQYNSVFCTMDEYDNKSGMIHISEVSAGRIKNIREFVVEGKKVYCKVLRVDKERGHIDLSLRRVGEGQKRERGMMLKQEQKVENMLIHLAKEMKKDPAAFYKEVAPAILEHYEYLHMAFDDIAEGKFSLSQTKLKKEIADRLEEIIKEKMQPKEVSIEGVFTISTFEENGVEKVKEALVTAREKAKHASIKYLGAGTYKLTVTAEEFKTAEKELKKVTDSVEHSFKKSALSTVAFERIEVKS